MSKITIIEGNSNDKDNVRAYMVKGEKGEQGDLNNGDIIDNLTSSATDKVLSAKQGKILKDLVDANTSNISSNAEDIDNETTARQNADTNLQNQISGLASGSPLVASSTSEMTDTTKVYVNTTDGNWYYYNSTVWTIGGVYQATEIADGSVTPKKTSFVKTNVVSDNKFNINSDKNYFGTANNDGYSVKTDGTIEHITGGWDRILDTLAPIDCSDHEGERLHIAIASASSDDKGIYRAVYFDATDAVLSYIEWQTNGIVIPSGAKRVIITTWHRENNEHASEPLIYYAELYANFGTKKGYSPYEETYQIDNLKINENNLDSDLKEKVNSISSVNLEDYEMLLPKKIFMIEEEPLRIYKSSLIQPQENIDRIRIALNSNFDFYTNHKLAFNKFLNEEIEFNTTDISNTLSVRAMTDKLGTMYGGDIEVVKCNAHSKTNKTPKINMFGDSTTYQGLTRGVKNTLQDMGMTPEFIGTVPTGTNENAEARSGYCYAQYIGYRTLNTNDTTETPLLPFLKVATATDKQNYGDWCFTRTTGGSVHEKTYNEVVAEGGDTTQNFYIFDYNYYLTNNNFDIPDVVTFGMGINDYWKYGEDATQICNKALTIMISQVHSANSNIKIGVVPFPINGNYEPFKAVWLKSVLSLVDTLNTQFGSNVIEIIAEYLSQSRELDFPYTSSNVAGKIQKKYTINDVIHTDLHGFREGAKPIAYYIINQL